MAPTATSFRGFPAEVFDFLDGLEKNNTKSYWDSHQDTWHEVIKPAVQDLMDDLEPQFGALRTFRPNRDVRFSKDKSPYKTWIGITTSDRAVGGVGSFMRLEASGLRLAAGAMAFAPDQVTRFRAALDSPPAASEFLKISEKLASDGLPVGPGKQPELKRVPRGFDEDHPHAALLKWKGAVIIKEFERYAWMETSELTNRVAQVWSAGEPLITWIEENVGEAPPQSLDDPDEPPRSRRRRLPLGGDDATCPTP